MLDKKATTDYPIHDLIAKRWSPRAFADKAVTTETLQQLFEAAHWASSCFNDQPWRFIVATKDNPEVYQKVLACLAEGNQGWAKFAPVLLIAVASTKFEQNGKPNAHALYDTGQAMATLAIQATSLDLYVHQMAGFSADQARATFSIPADFQPISAAAIGYRGDPNQLSAHLRDMEVGPRQRKPLSEFVFSENWGEACDIVTKT